MHRDFKKAQAERAEEVSQQQLNARKLGRIQKDVLIFMGSRHGGSWSVGCGWLWNTEQTERNL